MIHLKTTRVLCTVNTLLSLYYITAKKGRKKNFFRGQELHGLSVNC